MSTDKDFQEQLKYGEEAENIVYEYLINNNSCVLDLRNYNREEKGGPKLRGTEGTIILPDFGVFNKNPNKGNFTVDVKRKRSVYRFQKNNCFTVDDKFRDYKSATQIMKYDYLSFIFFFEDKMYYYRESDCAGHEFKSNDYGNGFVYYFTLDPKRIIY